jgi:lipoprotein-releasing system permease protein
MMIYEKMDSIAILKATVSGDDVKWVFVSLSIIIGFTGGFGLLFGYLVIIDNIPLKQLLAHGKTYPVDYNRFLSLE